MAAVGSLAAIAVTYIISPAMPGATTAISRFTKQIFDMQERLWKIFVKLLSFSNGVPIGNPSPGTFGGGASPNGDSPNGKVMKLPLINFERMQYGM